jgi:hypothetical protein
MRDWTRREFLKLAGMAAPARLWRPQAAVRGGRTRRHHGDGNRRGGRHGGVRQEGLSLGGQNLLGVILDAGDIHTNIGQRTADLVSVCRPTLTVVDAVRVLTANGPTGGDLNDVERLDTVLASTDIVAADAYAATLIDLTGADIPGVQAAYDMGHGRDGPREGRRAHREGLTPVALPAR